MSGSTDQLARACSAARMFLAEATPVYCQRRPLLSGQLQTAQKVYEFIVDYHPSIGHEDQEVFLVVAVNARHRATRVIEVSRGTLSSVNVHPREVFRELVRGVAAAFFVVYNHPSGDPEPSADDLKLTRRLHEAGELLGIPLLDHLVITDGAYVSLAEQGRI